jgi:hypothetical protein
MVCNSMCVLVCVLMRAGVLVCYLSFPEYLLLTSHAQPTQLTAKFSDGSEHPFGMMVWSAGLAPVKLVSNMSPVSANLVEYGFCLSL